MTASTSTMIGMVTAAFGRFKWSESTRTLGPISNGSTCHHKKVADSFCRRSISFR